MEFYHATKFLWLTILILDHTISVQVYGRTLNDELKDFCHIIPNDQMKNITEAHLKNDKEFNEAVIFLQSDTWANMLEDMEKNPEWTQLKKHLEHIGLNIDILFKSFFNFITTVTPIPTDKGVSRSFRSFFDDVESILPIGKILTMLHEKKDQSIVFEEFYEQLSSHYVHEMFENVRKQEVVKRITNELKAMGAHVDEMLQLFYRFMNWDSPKKFSKRDSAEETNILKQVFEGFVKLIPWNKLKNISDDHLANDQQFREAVAYLHGPEIGEILKRITVQREYIELKDYLANSGMDIEKIFMFLHDLIVNANKKVDLVGDGGDNSLKAYLDEIGAAMPSTQLLSLLADKMDNSREFNRFIKKISENKVRNMVENVRRMPESVTLFEKLQTMGVQMRQAFVIIYAFLGWGSPF